MKLPRKRTMIVLAVILLIIIGVLYNSSKKKPLNYTSAKVDRGEVTQTVSATGTVEATNKVDLKFLNPGKIAEIDVKVGDSVKGGQVLAKLDVSKMNSQLSESQASLSAAQANLSTLLEGASSTDIQAAQTTIDNAQLAVNSANQSLVDTNNNSQRDIASAQSALASANVALDNANSNLNNVKSANSNNLDTAYQTAWDGVSSSLSSCDDAIDAIDSIRNDSDAEDTLSVLNTQYLSNLTTSIQIAKSSRDAAESYKNSVSSGLTHDNVDAAIVKTQSALIDSQKSLSDTYDVLQSTITSSKLTQTKLDSLKANISAQRTSINTAISTLNSKKQAIQTQKVVNQTNLDAAQSSVNTASSALVSSQNNLASVQSASTAKINSAQNAVSASEGDLKQAQVKLSQLLAKPSSSKISAAQAAVDQAKANVDLTQKQINDSVITAPYDGLVTGVVGEVGEVASTTDPIVSIIIPNGFQITADISEVDIAKVKVGDDVSLTFDALGADQNFSGKVSEIDPAQTEIGGVVYYKVTTLFTADGNVIKPGMTSQLVIMTDKKENVLRIPFQALKENNGNKYVQTVVNNQVQNIPVQIGLMGDTNLEVTSGLSEGQEIVTFIQQ